MRTQTRSILVVALLLAHAWLGVTSGAQVFRVGEPAPVHTLPTVRDGAPSSIAQYRGKKVVLLVFASW